MENKTVVFNNVALKAIPFASFEDVKKYNAMSKTSQSKYYSELVQSFIKIVGKEAIYYFNITTKIWTIINDKEYSNFVSDFFDESSKHLKNIKKNINAEYEADLKMISSLISSFDNSNYMDNIIERSYSRLYDKNFLANLDNVKEFFPIKNGKKINLRTLEIFDRTDSDFFSYESPVDFLDGETPNADRFFEQVMPNEANREYLRKVLGYSLTTETCARVFFIWYGGGSNGKSYISRLMELILKQQHHACDKSIFIKGKQKSGGETTSELMALLGKRMSVYSEGETGDQIEMNTSGLKQISGEDSLCGRALYKDQITFTPYTKLHMLTNFKPPLNAENAIKQRLRYVFCDSEFVDEPDVKKKQFKKDKAFTEKLETIYLSEIFTWICKGSHEFYKTMTIEMSEEFKIRTNEMLSSEDSIKTFTDRKMQITNNKSDVVKKNTIFEAYKDFCNDNSQRCQPRSNLFNRLEHLGIKTSLLHGYDVYRGIKLLTEDPFDQPSPELDKGIVTDYEELYNNSLKEINDLKERIKQLEESKSTVISISQTSKSKKTTKKADATDSKFIVEF
jgi:P4 family phage/plasmid primase-like protien